MERMFLESFSEKNKFLVCRFGNVTHSHCSVIPFWLRLRKNNDSLKLTDKRMTRLMFSRDESVTLVHKLLSSGLKAQSPYILSKKMKTVNLYKLAKIVSDDIKEIGLRPGEKLYEELLISGEEKKTPNSKIFRSNEKFPSDNELKIATKGLEDSIEQNDIQNIKNIFKKHIEGFNEINT